MFSAGGDYEWSFPQMRIGMGLNLPMRRIVFVQTQKFDGKETRPLKTEEIGRSPGARDGSGLYDTGYINAVGKEALLYPGTRGDAGRTK